MSKLKSKPNPEAEVKQDLQVLFDQLITIAHKQDRAAIDAIRRKYNLKMPWG